MRPVKSDRTPARSRSRRTYARSSRVQAHDRRLLALERLEVRSMLASWSWSFELRYSGYRPSRPYQQVIVTSQVVKLPGSIALPAAVFVAWKQRPSDVVEPDDFIRLDGRKLPKNGNQTVTCSSGSLTFDLIDTTGGWSEHWGVELIVEPGGSGGSGAVPPPDTVSEGEVFDRCPSLGPTASDGLLRFYEGPAVSGTGLGSTFGLQRDSTAGSGTLSSPFGNGWSRTAAPTLAVHGTDPANPRSVSLAFGGTDTRVFRNVASAGSPPVFERSSGQGSTDRLTVSGGQFVFRTAAGSTFTFQGHGAVVPAAARGQLLSREDASGNRLQYAFNADGSTAQASTFLASQATAQEVHTYAYLPASDPQNAGKVR